MTTKRFGILLHTVVGLLPRWVVGIRRTKAVSSVEVKSYSGIRDFFGVLDEELFEYMDFEMKVL